MCQAQESGRAKGKTSESVVISGVKGPLLTSKLARKCQQRRYNAFEKQQTAERLAACPAAVAVRFSKIKVVYVYLYPI